MCGGPKEDIRIGAAEDGHGQQSGPNVASGADVGVWPFTNTGAMNGANTLPSRVGKQRFLVRRVARLDVGVASEMRAVLRGKENVVTAGPRALARAFLIVVFGAVWQGISAG